MTKIDPAWLEAFDKELLHLFAIDHRDAGMDEYLLGCYADLPSREAALAFGSDYDLERDDALWPRPGGRCKVKLCRNRNAARMGHVVYVSLLGSRRATNRVFQCAFGR